jgi:hypothetical protein
VKKTWGISCICFLDTNTMLLLAWIVLYLLNLSPRFPSTWQWIKWKKNVKVQLGALFQNLKSKIRNHNYSWNCFSTFLGYESKWSREEVLFSIGCVSKATFCVPHNVGEFEQIVFTLFLVKHLCCCPIFSRWPCCITLE